MHFLMKSPCSCDFLMTSLYIYSNKIIMAIGLTYECLILDTAVVNCQLVLYAVSRDKNWKSPGSDGKKFTTLHSRLCGSLNDVLSGKPTFVFWLLQGKQS